MVQKITIRQTPDGEPLTLPKSTVARVLGTDSNNLGWMMNNNSDLFQERGQGAPREERQRVSDIDEPTFVKLFGRLKTRGRSDRGIKFSNENGRMKVEAVGGEVLLDLPYEDAMKLIQQDLIG